MQHLIHYHAVHDPLTHPAPHTRPPHFRPQASKTPPEDPRRPAGPTARPPRHKQPRHPRAHLSPTRPPGPTQPSQAHPGLPNLSTWTRRTPAAHPASPPPDPSTPPLTPTTIRDPNLLRATLQGRALSTPLGWWRLQEGWTKLTVKALQDLTTPGNGLHEAVVDLLLWRARQHAHGQHLSNPPMEWGQGLTHDTDTNVTHRGTIRLQRAPDKNDHPADPNHPEQ